MCAKQSFSGYVCGLVDKYEKLLEKENPRKNLEYYNQNVYLRDFLRNNVDISVLNAYGRSEVMRELVNCWDSDADEGVFYFSHEPMDYIVTSSEEKTFGGFTNRFRILIELIRLFDSHRCPKFKMGDIIVNSVSKLVYKVLAKIGDDVYKIENVSDGFVMTVDITFIQNCKYIGYSPRF